MVYSENKKIRKHSSGNGFYPVMAFLAIDKKDGLLPPAGRNLSREMVPVEPGSKQRGFGILNSSTGVFLGGQLQQEKKTLALNGEEKHFQRRIADNGKKVEFFICDK